MNFHFCVPIILQTKQKNFMNKWKYIFTYISWTLGICQTRRLNMCPIQQVDAKKNAW